MIRLSKSSISALEQEAVRDVLAREYLGMGAKVEAFEKALSDYLGREAVITSSGTSALHLALEALDIGPGDEVLVPSLTYVASFQAISATGARAVSCDVRADDFIIDPQDAEERITPNTKAIMPVFYGGAPGKIQDVYRLAEQANLRVVEDAAHAFGGISKNQRIGSFGDISCFSFDGIKNITSGEGGCVVSSDLETLCRVSDSRLLGVEQDAKNRYAGKRSWDFQVTRQGWRCHMSDIMAAIGLVQLERAPEFFEKRRLLAKQYDHNFANSDAVTQQARSLDEIVPHIYPIRIAGLKNREGLREALLGCEVQTGIHYPPNHLLKLYQSKGEAPLPVTEKIANELLSLPLHVGLTETDIDYVSTTLMKLVPSYR